MTVAWHHFTHHHLSVTLPKASEHRLVLFSSSQFPSAPAGRCLWPSVDVSALVALISDLSMVGGVSLTQPEDCQLVLKAELADHRAKQI